MTQPEVPDDQRQRVEQAIDRLLAEHPPATADPRTFWGAQFDLGLAWVDFPEGLGGLGVSPALRTLVDQRLDEAGADRSNRRRNILGIGMGAGTIVAHGTRAQQERYLRPMFVLDELWCQLFSEPAAGSDLAGLATTAVREGDTWIVNGQKVWTSLAHHAKWGLLVARHDPQQVKHQGLTYFVVDMEAEGVDVRPLHQITGEAEFNEVYFDDVRIPDEQRIGEVGAGWSVAMTTLMNERVAIGGNVLPRDAGHIGVAIDVWAEVGGDDAARDRLVSLWAETEAVRLTALRAAQNRAAGTPGPEGSTAKIAWADLNKRITSFTLELLGGDGALYPGGYELRRPSAPADEQDVHHAFLRTRGNSIEGGTSEILRNIVGERVLGLPGEPRVDKDRPWAEVPRG